MSSRAAAWSCALLLAGLACSPGESEPIAAARDFARATRARDVNALLELLERDSVARLEAAAERASDQVGGRRNVEPREMLQVAEVDRFAEIAAAELVDQDGELAHVKLTGTDGSEHVLQLVLQDGAWRVRVPMPPVGSSAESAT